MEDITKFLYEGLNESKNNASTKESVNEAATEIKVGDYVSKFVKNTGGVSGTEGWVINIERGQLQISDEWGGYDKGRFYEPKGFKIGKKKSKEVSKHPKLVELIKEFGGSIG